MRFPGRQALGARLFWVLAGTRILALGAILIRCAPPRTSPAESPTVTEGSTSKHSPLARERPLIDDTAFHRGAVVWDPAPGKKVERGTLRPGFDAREPVWGLAQWNSRFSLAGAKPSRLASGAVRFRDGAKSVTFWPAAGGEADIELSLDGIAEYRGQAPEPGNPWPHILLERHLLERLPITRLDSLELRISFRLTRSKAYKPPGWNAARHTAQFLLYFTLQNRNRRSPGFGDYLWFGVPMYDARYRIPRAHAAVDLTTEKVRGTGKFIFNPSGDTYFDGNAADGRWITIEKNLLPLMHEALRTAWKRGYIQGSRDPADYCPSSINLGWEVTGPLSVAMQVKDLKVTARQRAAHTARVRETDPHAPYPQEAPRTGASRAGDRGNPRRVGCHFGAAEAFTS